jgi:hypothetical protein
MLIQSWRAMKLLEYVPRIGRGTLCACWYATGKRVHDSDKRYLDDLASQFSTREEFETIRARVLASVPDAEEFDRMLTMVRDKSIDVSVDELTELIEQGELPHHEIVNELVRKDEERRHEYEAREAFVEAPMPPAESLGKLFEDLSIANMLDGVPFGGYGLDWGHIKLERLDTYVKRYSTGYCAGSQFQLRHTTEGPYTQSARLAKGVTMFQTSFREVEEPYFVAGDGTKYTFLDAAYHDGSIVVKTRIERDGAEPEEGTYTVPTLRSMVGPVPEPKAKKRRRFGRRH